MFRTFFCFKYKVALFYNSVYFIFMKSFIYWILTIVFIIITTCIVFGIIKTGYSSGIKGIDLFLFVIGSMLIFCSLFCVLDLFGKGLSGIDKPYLLILMDYLYDCCIL